MTAIDEAIRFEESKQEEWPQLASDEAPEDFDFKTGAGEPVSPCGVPKGRVGDYAESHSGLPNDRADVRRLGHSFNMVELNSRANIDWRSRRRGCAVNTRSNPETLSVISGRCMADETVSAANGFLRLRA
jgi:hypothetical protein